MKFTVFLIVFICSECTVLNGQGVTLNFNDSSKEVLLRCLFGAVNQLNEGDYIGVPGFENATTVHFYYECLTDIPNSFLDKFEFAERLRIAYNFIKAIDAEDFRNNTNLKDLFLTANSLSELPEYLFKYTPRIERAYFSRNKIAKVHANAFAEGVENLKVISLSYNMIESLDVNLFAMATNLKEIDLQRNVIVHFEPELSQLIHLERLFLQANKLVELKCNIFPDSVANNTTIAVMLNYLEQVDLDCDYYNGQSDITLYIGNNRINSLTLNPSKLTNNMKLLVANFEIITIESDLKCIRQFNDLVQNRKDIRFVKVKEIIENCKENPCNDNI